MEHIAVTIVQTGHRVKVSRMSEDFTEFITDRLNIMFTTIEPDSFKIRTVQMKEGVYNQVTIVTT